MYAIYYSARTIKTQVRQGIWQDLKEKAMRASGINYPTKSHAYEDLREMDKRTARVLEVRRV